MRNTKIKIIHLLLALSLAQALTSLPGLPSPTCHADQPAATASSPDAGLEKLLAMTDDDLAAMTREQLQELKGSVAEAIQQCMAVSIKANTRMQDKMQELRGSDPLIAELNRQIEKLTLERERLLRQHDSLSAEQQSIDEMRQRIMDLTRKQQLIEAFVNQVGENHAVTR